MLTAHAKGAPGLAFETWDPPTKDQSSQSKDHEGMRADESYPTRIIQPIVNLFGMVGDYTYPRQCHLRAFLLTVPAEYVGNT
jgi:hypothetical protein